MSWIAAGMAALSIAGSVKQNKKTGKAFVDNANSVKNSFDTQIGQLQELSDSVQSDIALEMTANRYKGLQVTASTSNKIVESGVAGNTAARLYDNTAIMKMMSHNALAKKAEENAINFGVEMENKRRDANNAINQAVSLASANTISPIQATTKAAGAGMQGYSMGSAFSGAGSDGFGLGEGGFGEGTSYDVTGEGFE